MTFRFRRSIKVAPGIRLNLSKSGVSATVGPRGAKVTLNHKGERRSTVGIPGSGLSFTSTSRASTQTPPSPPSKKPASTGLLNLIGIAISATFALVLLYAFFKA